MSRAEPRQRRARPIGVRLAIAAAALVAGSIAVVLGFVYWVTMTSLERSIDIVVETEITGLMELHRREGRIVYP